jgi:hypothetical protein
MITRSWLHRAVYTSMSSLALMLLVLGTFAAPANAQIVQVTRDDARHSIGFNFGYLWVKPEDSRVEDDVLVADLSARDPLLFEINDFNFVTFGGEWLYAVSSYLETGVSISNYQRTVPSIYRDLENVNGAEIAQDLKLRMVPIDATIRFLPAGRRGVEPYFGGGVSFINWRYSESGEFVDSSDDSIFRETYKANGTAVGPVVLAGIRFPASDALTVGVEFRKQWGEGDTKPAESQLLGSKIDLGGQSLNFTMHFRF